MKAAVREEKEICTKLDGPNERMFQIKLKQEKRTGKGRKQRAWSYGVC